MSVTIRDFQPINTWEPDVHGPKWLNESDDCEPQFLVDVTTQRRYFNESTRCVRTKCFLLTVATPLVHGIIGIINIAARILLTISLAHFWERDDKEKRYNFTARLVQSGKDLAWIALAPLAFVGLEIATLYGLIRPYDGRKLYASIERGMYGSSVLAPCFQPNPTYHGLGGDINKKDSF